MTRLRLIALRHAKSAWDTDAVDDHDRPLSGRGRKEAPRVGESLAELDWLPDHVLSSDSRRTKQTWARIQPACAQATVVFTDALYHASGHDALRVIRAQTPAHVHTLMVIGHNPGWEELVHLLTGRSVVMTTANAVLMERDAGTWPEALAAGTWSLVDIIRPRDLG